MIKKKLSIEEKARAYDDAIKLARDYHEDKNCFKYLKGILENIFPEIQESDDERINREITEFIVNFHNGNYEKPYDYTIGTWLAWLEKQGIQKFIIPKFRVGDEIKAANEESLTITKIDEKGYWSGDLFICDFDEECIWDLVNKQKPVEWSENDDEIRKALIQGFNECLKSSSYPKNAQKYWHGIVIEDILAWLEKPREQKFADKVEPKFHEGNWIVNNNSGGVCKVTEIRDDEYCLWPLDAEIMGYLRIVDVDNEYHLWTIKDAKDGDVLAGGDWVFIFRKFHINGFPKCHCHYDLTLKEFKIDTDSYMASGGENYPATKEQCETLFQKMKDAGYEWDDEKKEVKKIPNALEECEIEHIEHGKYYYCIKDYYSGGCKRVSKGEVVQALRGMSMMALGVKANEYFIPVKHIVDVKPAWSEEDEKMLNRLIGVLDGTNKEDYHEGWEDTFLPWLKSLKDSVYPQQKQKWSEEDEENFRDIIGAIHSVAYQTTEDEEARIECLKNFKQRLKE